jgi:predicted dehydrogenase
LSIHARISSGSQASIMAKNQPRQKIRVGIIGVGNWANHGHLRVLALLPEYEVVAVYARRREAALAASMSFGVPHIAESVAALVTRADVDLVAVLTIAPQHEEAVRAAIAAGKNVYCEWPLTVNSTIAQELVQLASNAGIRHVVGLQRRMAPTTRYVRDLINAGLIGKLRSARLHVSMNYFQASRGKALRWSVPPENGSGVVNIYAGHFLDMLFAMIGKPTAVSAVLANQFPAVTIRETGETLKTTTPDVLVVAGQLKDDAVLSVHIEGGKRNGSGVQIDITGDAGDLSITNTSAFGGVGDDYVIRGASGDNMALQNMPVPADYISVSDAKLPSAVLELASLYEAFARDLDGPTQVTPNFSDATWMHRLIEAFERSAAHGDRVVIGPETSTFGV